MTSFFRISSTKKAKKQDPKLSPFQFQSLKMTQSRIYWVLILGLPHHKQEPNANCNQIMSRVMPEGNKDD